MKKQLEIGNAPLGYYVGVVDNNMEYLRPDLTVQIGTGYADRFDSDEALANVGYWDTEEEAQKALDAYNEKDL